MSISGITTKGYPAELYLRLIPVALWRPVQPSPEPRRRLILAHPERPLGGLDLEGHLRIDCRNLGGSGLIGLPHFRATAESRSSPVPFGLNPPSNAQEWPRL